MSLRNTITRLFKFGDTPHNEDLVSAWNLSTVNDSFGTNHLTNTGVVTFTAGKINNAATFDGTNYLTIADNATLSIGAGNKCSIVGWFKVTALPSAGNVMGICGKWDGTTNFEYIVDVDDTGALRFIVSSTGAAGGIIINSSSAGIITAGVWYFFVAWYDGALLYLEINNNGTIYSTTFTSDIFDGTGAFRIGNDADGTRLFTGQIDAIRLYKSSTRVLTNSERSALYNSGNGREYVTNTIDFSDEVNRELDQILALLNGVPTDTLVKIDINLEQASLTVNQNGSGSIIQFYNGPVLLAELLNNGTFKSYADIGNPPFFFGGLSSFISNLNVDLLDGSNASDILQTTSYLPLCSSGFFSGTPSVGDRVIISVEGNTLYQLKAFQRTVSSNNALTIIGVITDVNIETLLGIIEISGNSTAIVSTNLGDIALAETFPTVGIKRLILEIISISGAVKHSDITVSCFTKQLPF